MKQIKKGQLKTVYKGIIFNIKQQECILLNFWSEIGLFGMISFAGICAYIFGLGLKILKKNIFFGAALLASLVIIFIHGMVDVPYFKNDLAMLFWVITSLFFYPTQNYIVDDFKK
jgi:O-antigen ligase